ncbi:MAG: F0F1 ATP synthase subunit gamma, partial [Acidimicrobiales bacterium]
MAGGEERILRRRIKSVASIRKTTRALELIAGSRIVRAQQRILAARPYVERVNVLARDLAAAPGGSEHRLLAPVEDPESLTLVIISSDRGLAGSYDNTVLRAADRLLATRGDRPTRIVAIGRKAQMYMRYHGYEVDHLLTGITDRPTYEDARRLATTIAGPFRAGEVDRVDIVSTRFISAGVQKAQASA